MRFSLLLSTIALSGSLMLMGERAVAQVTDSTNQSKPELNTLPPDRPSLDGTPQLPPAGQPAVRPPEPTPQPAAPAQPGTFQPARPAQPRGVPAPAPRPVPQGIGTVKPAESVLPTPPPAKWYVTGNPDLGFSSSNGFSFFNVGLSAMFGYRFTDRFAAGPGLTYQYSSINGIGFSNFGGRLFGQAKLTDKFFVHLEHESLRAEVPYITISGQTATLTTERTIVNSNFGGVGYRQQFSNRAALDILVLYNFSHNENYFLYGQPEFRFNFLFDLF
jgi:hypothetical protein